MKADPLTLLARVNPWLLDGLIAGAMLVEIELEAGLDTTVPNSHRVTTALAAIAFVLPVMVRRRWPAGALIACATVALLQAPLDGNLLVGTTGTLLPPLLLAYTAGTQFDLRRGLAATLSAVTLLAAGVFVSSTKPEPGSGSLTQDLMGICALTIALWLLGHLASVHARRTRAFTALAARVTSQRAEREQAALAQQRMRISHELQDIIAQNVGAIVLQAGAAREMVRRDPGAARESIRAVEQVGREALADLRSALGLLLRGGDEPRAMAPSPRLINLEALVQDARQRGLLCELSSNADLSPDLPAGIDLVGYRVVEAALLAATEHGSRRVTITIGYRRGQLEVEVRSDGPVLPRDELLAGVTERVALYHGTLQVLLDSDRGWVLRALVPALASAR